MGKIILTKKGRDIIGSDGLMYIDGRFNLNSIKLQVIKRNKSYQKNFPHKIADGFYFVSERLVKISNIITI